MRPAAAQQALSGRVNWKRWLFQAGVSLAVLGILFWIVPVGEVLGGISQVSVGLFLAVWVAFLIVHVGAAMKWWVLTGRNVPASTALRAHFIGLTANLCLPGVAGGDAARLAVAWRDARDPSHLTAGSVGDRLIDLVALGCIAMVGTLYASTGQAALAWQVLPLVLVICIAGLLVGPKILAGVWLRFPKLPARGFVAKTCAALGEIGRNPLLLAGMLAWSIVLQGALILLALQLARSTGVEVHVAAWAFAWALAKLIVVLPVSLGGLGVREALLAALLAPYGAGTTDVVAGGLAWQAILFLSGGVGGVMLIRSAGRLSAQGMSKTEGERSG